MTFDPAAVRSITLESKASEDGNETGGILLGQDNAGELCVRRAGGPGPNAKRSTHRFLRDLQHARDLADHAYDADGSIWLGEWHTHPQGPATPSDIDLTTYTGHLSDASLAFDRFLACIVLPCPEHQWAHVILYAWIITPMAATVAEINVLTEEDDV